MPLTNFVDKVTTITHTWLNKIDALYVTVFGEATTKAEARAALEVTTVGDAVNYYTDFGTADNYILTSVLGYGTPTAYTDGMIIMFIPGNQNTGASTVNVNSLGVKNLRGPTGQVLTNGHFSLAVPYEFVFSTANDEFRQVSPEVISRTAPWDITINIATDADLTLTQEQNLYGRITITDTGYLLSTTRNIICLNAVRNFEFINETARSLVFKTNAGTGITVGTHETAQVFCDGTNVVRSGVQTAVSKLDDSSLFLRQSFVKNWIVQKPSEDTDWYGIAWSPELKLFAAVGGPSSTGNRIMTSPNGIDWTSRTDVGTALAIWLRICWSPGLSLFCAVASFGGTGNIMTSPDGITWTLRTAPNTNQLLDVCWSPELSLFVTVAGTGTGDRVNTSSDGINWTARATPSDILWDAVIWSPELSLFVAVADASGSANNVMTSPDGIAWTLRTSAGDKPWRSIDWSPALGRFVAVTTGVQGVMYSANGINWDYSNATPGVAWRHVVWAAELELFVALAENAVDGIMSSPDGINWTRHTAPIQNNWYGIAWAPEIMTFACVAFSGVGNRVMTPTFLSHQPFNKTGDTMTGALGITQGSVSAPSLFISGDTNTGIYSPAADTVAITTNGSEILRASSTDVTVGASTVNQAGDWLEINTYTADGLGVNRWSNNSNGSFLNLNKSRGATAGSHVIVADNDVVGDVLFSASDGTALIQTARIRCAIDGTPGTNDMPGRLAFHTTTDGASTASEKMRILNNGNVLIGKTTDDGALLQVDGQITSIGTTTNDDAAAGNVGEYNEANRALGSILNLTTDVVSDITSLSLTAGDWDVSGCALFVAGATTSVTNVRCAISLTSATMDTTVGRSASLTMAAAVLGVQPNAITTKTLRFSLASTTTLYFVARSTFTVSAMGVYGHISARRAR
jgi:hypothetical protein